jgi:hypothetical protein
MAQRRKGAAGFRWGWLLRNLVHSMLAALIVGPIAA